MGPSYLYNGNNYTVKTTLQWWHNEHNGVSYHQLHDCLLNRLFTRRSKWPLNSPHKGPVTWKMFPCDDIIMNIFILKQTPERHALSYIGDRLITLWDYIDWDSLTPKADIMRLHSQYHATKLLLSDSMRSQHDPIWAPFQYKDHFSGIGVPL